ncbi:MAG: hypothetical protein H6671_16460 [Anaerolineaceae bacterium]|nr:hypothetical protein [Anaerolineaceae bacterium]
MGRKSNYSVNTKARSYPLSGIIYCAQCEHLAEQHHNPRLRSLLSGHLGKYYRHKPGSSCGYKRQSIPRGIFEADFMRLIKTLDLRTESFEQLQRLAVQLNTIAEDKDDLEKQKAEAIALCNRRIQAAVAAEAEAEVHPDLVVQTAIELGGVIAAPAAPISETVW